VFDAETSKAFTTASGYTNMWVIPISHNEGSDTNLRIDMLQSSHDHSRERVTLGLRLFIIGLSESDGRVQELLIFESFNILRAVWVDILQALRELVIESVHKTEDTTADSYETVLLFFRGSLGEFIVVGCYFLHGVTVVCGHDVDQLVDLLLSGDPKIDGHMSRHRSVVVESSGDKGQKNTDPLILSHGDLEQFLEDADLFGSVSVLDDRC